MMDDKKLEAAFNFGAPPPTDAEQRAFFNAAANNDIRALGKILAARPDAAETWRNSSHQNIIAAACSQLQPATLQFLLDHKADIDHNGAGKDRCWSALQTVAFQGDVEKTEMYLRHGAQADSCDQYGQTPLMYAAQQNKAPCVDLLVLVGADPDRRDSLYKKSAFDRCPSDELRDVIRFAQKKRADFLASDAAQGRSPVAAEPTFQDAAPAAPPAEKSSRRKSWIKRLF